VADLFNKEDEPPIDRAAILKLNYAALAEAVQALNKVHLPIFEWPLSFKSVRGELELMRDLAKAQAKL